MSRSLNKVMLIGYTADEPQIRNFPNSKVANLTVVTNDRQKNSETGVYEEVPEWHRVSLWFRNADIVEQYVHKGTQVYIEGKIRTRSYTDNTGVKRYSTEIIGDQIILLSSRRDPYTPPVPGGPGQFVPGGPGQSVSVGQYPTGGHPNTTAPTTYPPINQSGSFDNNNYGSNTGTTGIQTPFPPATNMNNGGMNGGMHGSDVSQVGQDPFANASNNALNQNNSPWGQPSNQLNVNSMSDANSFAGSSSISAMPEMASGGFDQGAAPAPAPAPVPATAPAPTVEKGGDDEDIPF